MKNILRSLLLVLIIGFTACEKSLEEVNIDPNTSPSANEGQVLTAAIGYLGYVVDVDLNSRSFLWGQYYTWGIGVSLGNQARYVAEPDDFDGYWERAYANSLTDLNFLTKSDDLAYSGVAKVLEVYIYQGLVDHFGDVPFTEAISGEIADGSVLAPKFDSAADVYKNLVTKIDEAISDLNGAGSGGIGSEDLIFNGDLSKWMKFANSLKLRLLMRTSEVDPQGDAVKNLIAEGNFLTSNDDIASIPFSGSAGDQNPMYARFEWGVGDFYFASNSTLNLLTNLADPRANAFYSSASTGTFEGQLRGIDHGSVDEDVPFTDPSTDYSGSSPIAYGVANDVILMSDWEVWFLRAEAAARYGTADDEIGAFETAIANNFTYLGVAGSSDYIAARDYGSAGSLDDKLNMIGMQKWISMNGTQEDEGWIETRRFDRAGNRMFSEQIFHTPNNSVLPENVHPSTWLYPSSERSLNPNAPEQRTLTDKIFWDN